MLAFRYVALHYLKYFAVILSALVLFYVGFDYMQKASSLNLSANLLLIYLVYKAFFAIDTLLPISLVFAMISTKIFLIRSNALVSFYSLRYSRVDILKPFVVVSVMIIALFISLHGWSKFARSAEFYKNIQKNSQYLNPTRDMFFTYKGQYIYFNKLIPLQEKAYGIRVFKMENGTLSSVTEAKEAIYRDGYWLIKEADIIKKPKKITLDSKGIGVTQEYDLKILQGFRPKILDQVYEGQVNFTIGDAYDAIKILEDQNINTSVIRGALYKIFIYPFFAPSLIVIIFFFVPISVRFLNLSLFSFGAILSTLLVWGILFMFLELTNNKTISSEMGVIFPVTVLLFIALWQWIKHKDATH
jgi:lipopolysaccharide export system permease protein